MRVALINPPLAVQGGRCRISPVFDNLFFNSPPLGLAYLAAVLEKEHIPVMAIDAAVERLCHEEIAARVRAFGTDVVGLTSTTFSFSDAVALARHLKRQNPKTTIVLGGSHVSAVPESALAHDCFDVGVLGEGEATFPLLLKHLFEPGRWPRIDGLAFRRERGVLRTPPRALIEDLDALPFPARHLFPMALYRPQPNDERDLPKLSMISSRGCPYGCIFCGKSVFGRTYRSFSASYIVSEMEHLVDRYGARDIAFVDSLFTVSEARVRAIVAEIKKRRLPATWTCTVRADAITSREILREMKESGCWRIRLGVESGDAEVLKFIRKEVTREQVARVAGWAQEAGLQPKGFFMVGHLPDTQATIEETIAFAKTLPLKDVTVQVNTPLPGTEQYSIYPAYGALLTKDWSQYSFFDAVFLPRALSRDELRRLLNRFYRTFYLRPVIFWRHVVELRGPRDILRYLRALRLLACLFFAAAPGPESPKA